MGCNWNSPQKIEELSGGLVAKTPYPQCSAPGSMPGQGTRSHMPQVKIPLAIQLRPGATK